MKVYNVPICATCECVVDESNDFKHERKGHKIESVEMVLVESPNVLSHDEAHHAAQNLSVGAPQYHKEVRPEIEALADRLAHWAADRKVS